ncbi:TERF1-interacting nuclear factor 2 [Scomber scombrus]|uniref:TERF1-interacting nuclear factor 2 n=1 Tax=Scomber scombrus TaxID=13677 RepID=UPI002DDB5A38|nr:TERF1-interacting nuclear factor 2 [Scomber scombrus]
MATRKPKQSDAGLPFAALQLLAPPVRLVSAALWKVMKQRDVMQYGAVEEFVTSACETVPGLLTLRHQGKLALGLRARLILELCHAQSDAKVIETHLKRIRAPAPPSHSSAPTVKKDLKIMNTVERFHALVQTLLTEPAEREQFFKEEFPVDYGPTFDQELEKLLWEFLIRLDQMLPVPNLAQTVSWLSDAPPVLEECARAATQPQLLEILLKHQTCLGHLETAASLPPNMGDSILASLSLPPSGRVPSNQPTGPRKSFESNGTQIKDNTPFITPVIGLISNDDVPFLKHRKEMASSKGATSVNFYSKQSPKFTSLKPKQKSKDDGEKEDGQQAEKEEERNSPKRSNGVKRKQPDGRESASEEEDEVLCVRTPVKMRMSGSSRYGGSAQRVNESEKDRAETGKDEGCKATALETRMKQLGVRTLHLPEDPSLRSIFVSCLNSQPKVIIEKLSVTPAGVKVTDRGGHSSYKHQQRRKSPVKAPTHKSNQPQKLDSDFPGLDDKENHPVLPSLSSSSSHQRSHTETSVPPGDGEDYVADSEDEATKNFKGRLFVKRYYKTKHGTYVPTLREYWKPGMTRRDLAPRTKRR